MSLFSYVIEWLLFGWKSSRMHNLPGWLLLLISDCQLANSLPCWPVLPRWVVKLYALSGRIILSLAIGRAHFLLGSSFFSESNDIIGWILQRCRRHSLHAMYCRVLLLIDRPKSVCGRILELGWVGSLPSVQSRISLLDASIQHPDARLRGVSNGWLLHGRHYTNTVPKRILWKRHRCWRPGHRLPRLPCWVLLQRGSGNQRRARSVSDRALLPKRNSS
jgi:hypothetical protein